MQGLKMKLIVTGRTGSGKSEFKDIAELLIHVDIIEITPSSFISAYREGDKIVVVDTPAILCCTRAGEPSIIAGDQKREDYILSHVTELPNCTIIKNAGSLDDFRVKIKKFIRTL